jgi:hypothetical protein
VSALAKLRTGDPRFLARSRQACLELAEQARAFQGDRAFDNPKAAAVAHETGHCIAYAHEGIRIKGVSVWQVATQGRKGWIGNTESPAWKITPTTPSEGVMQQAAFTLAGWVAEMFLAAEDFRCASSLDEVVLTQALIGAACARAGGGDPREEFLRLIDRLVAIFDLNRSVAEGLMERLSRVGRIKGRVLQEILGKVQRLD